MSEPARPIVAGPGEGATITGPVGGPLTFKARAAQTAGRLTAIENVLPPGEGPPVHVHRDEDEVFYVLEGELAFRIGEDVHPAPAGTFLFIPRGVPHAPGNLGTKPARVLVMFTPAGMEQVFERLAELQDRTAAAAAFRDLGAAGGMDVVGPPLTARGRR